ncbi:MAG: DNA-directed RNA polymerase subunit N [Euryarchaeota archaeon]|nr:DNA-directed RNA polymerase subunit N [Euryarchaeota archaeon]
MLIPVRCFSCGAVVADKYEEFRRRVEQKENPKEVLDSLGVERYCCRRMLLSQGEFMESMHVKGP